MALRASGGKPVGRMPTVVGWKSLGKLGTLSLSKRLALPFSTEISDAYPTKSDQNEKDPQSAG